MYFQRVSFYLIILYHSLSLSSNNEASKEYGNWNMIMANNQQMSGFWFGWCSGRTVGVAVCYSLFVGLSVCGYGCVVYDEVYGCVYVSPVYHSVISMSVQWLGACR